MWVSSLAPCGPTSALLRTGAAGFRRTPARPPQSAALGRNPPRGSAASSGAGSCRIARTPLHISFFNLQAMSLEGTLSAWTAPSSDTEQEKQERTERMIRAAIAEHEPLKYCALVVYAKGSYANSTNVRADSDVDVAVQCTEVEYWEEATPGARSGGSPYGGIWTPEKLRSEVEAAMRKKFGTQVDASGSTAIQINSSTARVDADVVPCFSYRYYFPSGSSRVGTRIFKKDGGSIDNYPAQQLENGRAKNVRTGLSYKKAARILKRLENAMVDDKVHRDLPSYFIECLTYNCPDNALDASTWTEVVRRLLSHIWNGLQGEEPSDEAQRWLEVNECYFLFHPAQKWTRADGREFAYAAWNYLGFK